MSDINVNNDYTKMNNLTPFKLCVLQNFPFIEADFDAVTNYQLLCKVVEYLNNVIDNNNKQNSNITQLEQNFITLYNYVKDYFDNLDVQDEINKKLDEMLKNGDFTDIFNNDIFTNYIGVIVPSGDIDNFLDLYTNKEVKLIFTNRRNYNVHRYHVFNKNIELYSNDKAIINVDSDGEFRFMKNVVLNNIEIECNNDTAVVDRYLINTYGDDVYIYDCKLKQIYSNNNSKYSGTCVYAHNAKNILIMNSSLIYNSFNDTLLGGALYIYSNKTANKTKIINSYLENNTRDEIFGVYGEYSANVIIENTELYGFNGNREFSITASALSDNRINLTFINCYLHDLSSNSLLRTINSNGNTKNGYALINIYDSIIEGRNELVNANTNDVTRKENVLVTLYNTNVTCKYIFNILYNGFLKCVNSVFNISYIYNVFLINSNKIANVIYFFNSEIKGIVNCFKKSKDIIICKATSIKALSEIDSVLFADGFGYDTNEEQKYHIEIDYDNTYYIRPVDYYHNSVDVSNNNVNNMVNKSYYDNRLKEFHCDIQFQITTDTKISITFKSYGSVGNNVPVIICSTSSVYYGFYNGLTITSNSEIPSGYYFCKFIN